MPKIKLKVKTHIQNRGVTQKEFAHMSGLREATISQVANNKLERIQLDHLAVIMETLNITDFNEVFELSKED